MEVTMSIEDMADALSDAAVWSDPMLREQFLNGIKAESYKLLDEIELLENRASLYDFRCRACGHGYNEDSDRDSDDCPECDYDGIDKELHQ